MDDRTVLITGAAGMVGSHVQRSLHLLDIRTVGVDQKQSNNDSKYQVLQMPISKIDKEWIMKNKISSIIHLGAFSSSKQCSEASAATVMETNVVQTIRLYEIAKECKLEKYIFASSEWVYGQNWKSESALAADLISTEGLDLYSRSKLYAEQALSILHKGDDAMRLCILRFGIIYGSLHSSSVVDLMYRASRNNTDFSVSHPLNARRFVHISDVVNALVNVFSSTISGTFDLQGPSLYTLADVADIFSATVEIDQECTSVRDISCTLPATFTNGVKIEDAEFEISVDITR